MKKALWRKFINRITVRRHAVGFLYQSPTGAVVIITAPVTRRLIVEIQHFYPYPSAQLLAQRWAFENNYTLHFI